MSFDNLNPEQKTAVEQNGHVLLTACPGSGKTRVIINKLAHESLQLNEGNKKRAVAVTFTIRAADEIFRRLIAMGIDDASIWSGTLHSFCLEWIVRPYSCYLPELSDGFAIADESYCSNLITQLKEEFQLPGYAEVITRLDRNGDFVDLREDQRQVLHKYHTILGEAKLIDFDLLLFCAYRILLAHPKIPKTLSNLFSLICVDEFQDTQDLLYAIICLIVKTGEGRTSLFMVGDTDQAIYASLGGIAKSIPEIRAELDQMPIVQLTLQGNYRSSQRIIDFYSNFQIQKIQIQAIGENAGKQGLISFDGVTGHEELVEEIARIVELHLNNGISEDEICILVPQWRLITNISRQLRKRLPEVSFDASGLAPMSRNRENIWYKLSRLLLTEPSPRLYSARQRWSAELIDRFTLNTGEEFRAEIATERGLLKLINSISSDETEGIDYLNDCFDQFLAGARIEMDHYPSLLADRELYFENVRNRLSNQDLDEPSDITSFKNFYREMTGVVINTCVGVKGEEFETVIAFGLLRGLVPHWQQIMDPDFDDETASKKMLYVICSRAKVNLHLIAEKGRFTGRGNEYETNYELEAVQFQYDQI